MWRAKRMNPAGFQNGLVQQLEKLARQPDIAQAKDLGARILRSLIT